MSFKDKSEFIDQTYSAKKHSLQRVNRGRKKFKESIIEKTDANDITMSQDDQKSTSVILFCYENNKCKKINKKKRIFL